jgi:hypothetical protein
VKDIIISKKNRLAGRKIIDSITLLDNVSWNVDKEPIGEVTRSRDAKDYYKAISLSCTLFQNYGKEILLSRSKNTSIRVPKKRLSLAYIICELYAQNIIDRTIYDKINKVKEVRNEFQHEDMAIRYSSSQAEAAETIINQALECITFIKSKFDSM